MPMQVQSFLSLFVYAPFKIYIQLMYLKLLIIKIIKLAFHCKKKKKKPTSTNSDFLLRFVGELKMY